MEFEPIYPAGFHEISLEDIDKVFVEPFENNEKRKYLTNRLKAYLAKLEDLKLNVEVWLDGSYSTHKPEPGDIDILVVFDQNEVNRMYPSDHVHLINLGVESYGASECEDQTF